jgi:hypothetical protein
MEFRRAYRLLWGLALLGVGMGPALAKPECPYLTRPFVEIENGIARINQWAHGTLLCYRGRMLRCEVGSWYDYGVCPQGPDWEARDADLQERSARPLGVTTPAPALPATPLPAPPTMAVPLPALKPAPPPAAEPAATPVTPVEEIATPPKAQPPQPEATPPEPPPASSMEAPPVDCSDMQRLSFERVFNKSIAESQRCQAGCTTDDCKLDCKNQHDNVRAPQIMERFHVDTCSPTWYP